jgi:hypothetical protein
MRTLRALALGVGVAVLGGCSQVAQLQPVAGDQITAIRIATIDVLTESDVSVLVAPNCTDDGNTYKCQGTTMSGAPITSVAVVESEYGATTDAYGTPEQAKVSLKVKVGSKQIYSGTVQEVLDRAGQGAR